MNVTVILTLVKLANLMIRSGWSISQFIFVLTNWLPRTGKLQRPTIFPNHVAPKSSSLFMLRKSVEPQLMGE